MHRHIHFVTGKLAEPSLRRVVQRIATELGFAYSIDVLPITVAALLTPKWIAPRLQVPETATEIMLPGYCDGDLTPLRDVTPLPVIVGPKELRALPDFFSASASRYNSYGEHQIEIIAEINHAPRLSMEQILAMAASYRDNGADLIDVGCEPNASWGQVGECVRQLRLEGHRVSVDSLDRDEIAAATAAGAELVLSVNSTNRDAATDWGVEVVVIPDDPHTMSEFDQTVSYLESHNVAMRLDPILEPIGCGVAASLARYVATRQRFPDHAMMMGIGNVTELTDVDSAGLNVLLLGICAELGIHSVLTTEVIHWARTSVRECDLARRLVHFAAQHGVPPKRLDPALIVLRDHRLYPLQPAELETLAASLKDQNYRLFAQDEALHLLAADLHLQHRDPFRLFQQLMATEPRNVDASHAFYLGYELAKASIALQLGKQYNQDQSLDWGYLTQPEPTNRHRDRD